MAPSCTGLRASAAPLAATTAAAARVADEVDVAAGPCAAREARKAPCVFAWLPGARKAVLAAKPTPTPRAYFFEAILER